MSHPLFRVRPHSWRGWWDPVSYSPLWPMGHSGSLPRLLAHPCCSSSLCLPHGLCPSFLRPPLTGAAPACTGSGQPTQPLGQQLLCHALCASKTPPPRSGPQASLLSWAPPTPAKLNPSSWGLARAAQGRWGRGMGARQARSKAKLGLAGTQPPEPCTRGPHSVSLETGEALLRK